MGRLIVQILNVLLHGLRIHVGASCGGDHGSALSDVLLLLRCRRQPSPNAQSFSCAARMGSSPLSPGVCVRQSVTCELRGAKDWWGGWI